MTIRRVSILAVMAVTLAATPAPNRTWMPVGAPGGDVRALASDPHSPERMYLGTADGLLYRSEDGGVHWLRMTPGFPLRGCSLDEIVVDPQGTVFVGYWQVHETGGGVARSTDGGKTFEILKGIEGESVRAVAMAPSDPRTIAAGTLTGVFLSQNGGTTWKRVTPSGHPDLRNFESLAFDPDDARVLYAGTWHLPWKTMNSGAEWHQVPQGMIDDSDVMTLTVDGRHSQTVYATACTGIYRSRDGGGEWTKLRGIPFSSRRTRAFAVQDNDPKLLLAGTTEGLWTSEDGGVTWDRKTPKDLIINAVSIQPDGTVLLGTEGAGVMRSPDRGRTWVASNAGFSERFVSDVLFDTSRKRIITAVMGSPHYGGVFVSRGIPGPWTRLGEGLGGHEVLSIARVGATIVAGTDDGLFEWTPEATEWARVPIVIDGRLVRPRVSELLALGGEQLLAATSIGMIRTPNAGWNWRRTDLREDEEVFALAAPRDDASLVIAAAKGGFYRSGDGGSTWKLASTPLDPAPHALAFAPDNNRVVYVTTSAGLYRSNNLGTSWRRVNGGLPHSDLTGIAIHPDGGTLYVSDFTWGGIFRSTDGGSKWSRMPTDGLGSDRVWALSVDPSAPDRVYASASAGGLHVLLPTDSRRRADLRTNASSDAGSGTGSGHSF